MQKLLNEELDIQQKIKDFEQCGNNWLEPMKGMILQSSQAKILLSQGDNNGIYTFLKKIGSNFILKDKKLRFEAKIGWRVPLGGTSFTNWRCVRSKKLEPILPKIKFGQAEFLFRQMT